AAGLPASSCSLRRWGARVLATCGARGSDGGSGDDEHANLYVSDDGRQFRPLLDVRASTHDVRAGADGRALAWVSGDDVHVWTDAGAVVVPVGTECRGRLLAVHGERVVLAGRQSPICVLDVERRSIAPMQTSERIEDVHAETTSEGALLVCGNYEPEGDRPKVHRCWRSLDGGALQVMPLPEGTRAVSMVDASRAMALGATLANAWRTDDGGARWTPLAIPGVVGAERIELASANRDARPSLACFPERCVIGPNFFSGSTVAVTFWGWGAPTPGSLRLLATDPLRFAGGAAATESPPMLRVRCEATPGRPPRVREPRAAPEGSDVWIGGGGGAFARLVLAAGDEPNRTGTLQWWGHDERGAWSVASRPVDVAAHLPPSTRGSSTRLVTSVLTRTTALVELCADGCTTFFARPGRPLVAVPTIRGRAYDPDLGIALADGGVARAVGDYPATRVHILDGEGRVSRTVDRAIPFAPDRLRALTDTADALVHPVARRGWIALPLDDTRMPTRASSSDAPLRACTAPRAADARTVHVGTGSDVRGLASSQPRAVVELTASGACVRTLEIWPAAGAMADAPSSGRLTAGTDGAFTGWIASDRGERGTYRCTLDGTGGTTPP
ncbi:MAG: hypothetical protein IT379_03400, partial [Deltaproteobacteria bacterium]|nr:hypothetical protein [Deltaproteobacteria bacterium]